MWLWCTSVQNLKENPSKYVACRAQGDFHQHMTFDPIKDGTLGAASPTTIGVEILTRYTSIQNLKEIRQEMQLLERTQECEPKYDLWPYKRRNTGGSITKNYMCVDVTMMHVCPKFEINPSWNVACRGHKIFPPKYDLWPYKRRNTWVQHHQKL